MFSSKHLSLFLHLCVCVCGKISFYITRHLTERNPPPTARIWKFMYWLESVICSRLTKNNSLKTITALEISSRESSPYIYYVHVGWEADFHVDAIHFPGKFSTLSPFSRYLRGLPVHVPIRNFGQRTVVLLNCHVSVLNVPESIFRVSLARGSWKKYKLHVST